MSEMERLTDAVKELLEAGRDGRLAAVLEEAHAADLAAVVRELPPADQVRVFRLLAPDDAGAVLSELDDPTTRELLRSLDETEVTRILEHMPSDHVVEVVEELPKAEAEKLLDLMEEEKSEEIQELLEYRDGSAGRLMSPNFVAVSERATVGQAIEHIRKSRTGDDAFYDQHEDRFAVLGTLPPVPLRLRCGDAAPVEFPAGTADLVIAIPAGVVQSESTRPSSMKDSFFPKCRTCTR